MEKDALLLGVPADRMVSLYGTTPPRADAGLEDVARAAERLADRVRALPIDGLVVYDVQDEATRTSIRRPFLPTIDPRHYSRQLHQLTGKPTVTYKCVADMTRADWSPWLAETHRDYGIDHLSLVGLPSSRGATSVLPLSEATRLAATHLAGFTLGGVAIAERHGHGRNESERMLRKAADGCRFFISQAVYDAETTIRLLTDYARDCAREGVTPRRVILTFIPCGRARTLAFIRWLGIAITDATAASIFADAAPLSRSIAICRDHLQAILSQDYVRTIPLGLNVESVSIYKDEIDASIDLHHALHDVAREFLNTPAAGL
ncbi:hypothetical protein [Reyranella sp. CPCC 100927]|uniref:hypothetical protein n=1 Tax=Reyranella sp. CPCC 100927 TaxID=2599616 RepID=UPI0011B3F2A6|nr:hypothetical protein [Reyranella sp. CPCC 100927]TWT05056.1 hypothetical protein FQU96_25745 [Reyranella sp. CPCC 100927]